MKNKKSLFTFDQSKLLDFHIPPKYKQVNCGEKSRFTMFN